MKLLIACVSIGLSLASASHALAADKLRLAIGGKGSGESVLSDMGQMAGIFKKHGLDLDIFYTAGSGETQQAVISGSADIGVATGTLGVIGAFAKGAPIRIIAASFTGDSNLYWYVPAASPIREPKDMAGKTVAFSTNGSSAHNAVLLMQKHLGMQFRPTATGAAPATFAQVMTGQVDVGWAGAPFGVDKLEAGEIRRVWSASDVPAVAAQTSRVIVARADLLKSNPDLVQRYMDAYRETVDWAYSSDDGPKALAEVASVSLAAAKRTMAEFVTKAGVNPDKVSDIEGVMRSGVEFHYIPAALSPEQIQELVQIPPRKK